MTRALSEPAPSPGPGPGQNAIRPHSQAPDRRLDTLALAAGRLPQTEERRLVELSSVATVRAVALELLDAERAAAIWSEAYERHPALPAAELRVSAAVAVSGVACDAAVRMGGLCPRIRPKRPVDPIRVSV